jgi:hypothetical protein
MPNVDNAVVNHSSPEGVHYKLILYSIMQSNKFHNCHFFFIQGIFFSSIFFIDFFSAILLRVNVNFVLLM